MNTQIYTRITIENSPAQQENPHPAMSEQQSQKDRNGKSVGGMSREESIFSSPIIIDDIDKIHQLRVIGRTKTRCERFHDAGRKLVRDENAQQNHQQNHPQLSDAPISKNDIEQQKSQWNPR